VSVAPQPASSRPPQIVSTLWFFAWAGPLVAGGIAIAFHALVGDDSASKQYPALWPLAILGLPMLLAWIYLLGIVPALTAGLFAHVTRTWTAEPWLILRYVGMAVVGLAMTYLSLVYGFNIAGRGDNASGLWMPLAVGAIAAVLTALWAARRRLI
jgi:hypothetical protein